MHYRKMAGRVATTALAIVASGAAWATNGTQLTAYGSKAQGMGGVSLAFPQDALAAANNPAGMAFVGHRLDLSGQFVYVRSESSFLGLENKGSGFSPVPEFGYNLPLNDKWTVGVSTAASGAGFKYDDQLFTGAPKGTEGLYLATVVLPTVTYKPTDNLAFGASLAFGIHGLDIKNFPGVGDHGMRFATGTGARLGAMWNPSETLSFGAFYATKVRMGELDGYSSDILASVGGRLDLPEQWGVGIAKDVSPKLKLGLDYLRINWADTQFNDLFGYRDQDVWRIGGSYQLRPDLTLRAGASIANRHFDDDYVNNNLLLTGINPNAISAGFTKVLGNGAELTSGFEYDFGSRADGSGPSSGSYIDTEFFVVSVGYGMKF